MAFDLKSIASTKRYLPERIIVFGVDKIGKSTFAANAEKPIFICTEEGQDDIDVDAFPLCLEYQNVMDALATLYDEDHDFKTVIVDTLDWFEHLIHKKVEADKGVKSITDIGYSKGFAHAAIYFREFLDGLDALRKFRNMRVILLVHHEIKRFDDPLNESYDRYKIKLEKRINSLVREWADIIGFATESIDTKTKDVGFNKDRTRSVTLGQRVLKLKSNAAYDSGCRYDMPDEVPLIWTEFEKALNKARGITKEKEKK